MHSTADHSVPQLKHPQGIVAHAWLQRATTKNNPQNSRVSSDTPEPPLSAQESEEAALILGRWTSPPQPVWPPTTASRTGCHSCMQLLPLLSEGVPTGALSELPRSMQWPPKGHADIPHELTECMGNWKAAEAEPATVLALLETKSPTGGSSAQKCPSSRLGSIGIKALL